MVTTPQPRDIPAGKILLAEYGDQDFIENRAQVNTLASAWSDQVRAKVRLEHSSPGYEMAGSCARWTNGWFAVRWLDGSATYGQRYKDDAEGEIKAREHFAKLTTQEGR